MIYVERDKLTILEIQEERDYITFEEIISLLRERPADMIYVEYAGKLYGVISMRDVDWTDERIVKITKSFSAVCEKEYMQARQLFRDRQFSAIPVLDNDGKLLGEYNRWDGWLCDELRELLKGNAYLDQLVKDKKIVLVKPCPIFKKKQEVFEKWAVFLEKLGARVKVVEREAIMQCYDEADEVLFIDENERRATKTLLYTLLDMNVEGWNLLDSFSFVEGSKLSTYNRFADQIVKYIAQDMLEDIQKKGVHVFILGFAENENGYLKQFKKKINRKYSEYGITKRGVLADKMKKDFFDEIYDEKYEHEKFPFFEWGYMKDGVQRIDAYDRPLFCSLEGERLTLHQPSKYHNCIYMYGQCVVLGAMVEDKHTIASMLQNKLNEDGYGYKVINCGMYASNLQQLNKIAKTPLQKGDIVVWYARNAQIEGVTCINLANALEDNNVPVNWFTELPEHCNYKVNALYADCLYKELNTVLEKKEEHTELICKNEDLIIQSYINRYFDNINLFQYKRVGSIVMNCNPFTLGHKYLIGEALKRVDFLIIFVVEEDASYFSFEERFAMVCKGTAEWDNVMVVPSGDFILSKSTFPEYFAKAEDEHIIRNMEGDVTLFAQSIAPKLNITSRFLGEELSDMVTAKYNETIKRILPVYGLEVVEIPRKSAGDKAISATRVRKCLEEWDLEKIDELVPQTTKEILFR